MADRNICAWCDKEHGQEATDQLQCIVQRLGTVLLVGNVALQNMAYALRRMDELQREAREALGLDDMDTIVDETDAWLEQANEEFHAGQWGDIRDTYDKFTDI